MRATFEAAKGFVSYSVERVRKGAEFEMEGYVMKVALEKAPHACASACGVSLASGYVMEAVACGALLFVAVNVLRRHKAAAAAKADPVFDPFDMEV